MKKFFISATVLIVACISLCSTTAEGKKQEDEGARICCSSGDRGACFAYVEQNTSFPVYDCVWTGLSNDSCYFLGILVRVIRDWV